MVHFKFGKPKIPYGAQGTPWNSGGISFQRSEQNQGTQPSPLLEM